MDGAKRNPGAVNAGELFPDFAAAHTGYGHETPLRQTVAFNHGFITKN
jgi:hypothetical protein